MVYTQCTHATSIAFIDCIEWWTHRIECEINANGKMNTNTELESVSMVRWGSHIQCVQFDLFAGEKSTWFDFVSHRKALLWPNRLDAIAIVHTTLFNIIFHPFSHCIDFYCEPSLWHSHTWNGRTLRIPHTLSLSLNSSSLYMHSTFNEARRCSEHIGKHDKIQIKLFAPSNALPLFIVFVCLFVQQLNTTAYSMVLWLFVCVCVCATIVFLNAEWRRWWRRRWQQEQQ